MTAGFTCPMCGFRFDPAAHTGCQACPVNTGCTLICCPQCGYSTVDEQQSALVRWVGKWLPGVNRRPGGESAPAGQRRLAAIPPGQEVQIAALADSLTPERRLHLLAYGVTPGSLVTVLRQAPVTVILVDHLELALETTLADQIWVGEA